MKTKETTKCEKCGKKIRNSHIRKGKFLCFQCMIKDTRIPCPSNLISLEEALNRVYEVKGYLGKDSKIISGISIPKILIGHKIKFVLVE